MKFAEYVDIWVQIIYAKFKNDRAKDNGDTGGERKWKRILFFLEGFEQCVFHCCVTVQCPNPEIIFCLSIKELYTVKNVVSFYYYLGA